MKPFPLAVVLVEALASQFSWTEEKKRKPELLVAAAADLNPALNHIAQQFEKKTGVRVRLSFGASGSLTQQIQNGAPYDIRAD